MPMRSVVEGRQVQGRDERLRYTIASSPWGTGPSDVEVTVWLISDLANWRDMSDVTLEGDSEVHGDIITTPWVSGLIAGALYRAEVRFTCGDNTFECYFDILGEK
jgi:hypothetical protein